MMVFQANREQYTIENTRAFAEPNLEEWLEENLWPLDKIACLVKIYDIQDDSLIDTAEISLADLLSYNWKTSKSGQKSPTILN